MKLYPAQQIRNIGLFGHGSAGKTSLVEALLFHSGAIPRLGKIEDGTTTTDHDPDAIRRKMTVSVGLAPVEWQDHKVNLVDTPGYADFFGEVVEAMRVIDCALIVVEAVSGVQVGTVAAWNEADRHAAPRMVFVNKMERENADYGKVIEQLRERWGVGVIPLTVPIGAESQFGGVIDLARFQAFLDDKGAPESVPADLADAVAPYREMLVESVSELDDELLTRYLDGEEITAEQLTPGLKQGIAERKLVPVLAGSAAQAHGIRALLDALINLAPAAADTDPRAAEGDPTSGTAALVFKTVSDPFVGRLTYLRSFVGEVKGDAHLWNPRQREEERIGQVFTLRGKQQEPTPTIPQGDLGVVAKLANTHTGDTLTARDKPIVLERIQFPEPIYSVAIEPKTKNDLEKLGPSLARLVEEDPSLSVHREQATGQTILSGLGESHIELACERLQRKFGVSVSTATPKVAYRETIRGPAKAEGRHVRQTGGHGQYGVCWVSVEPMPRGGGFEFVDKIVGGVVSHSYRPAVEKGIREAMDEGVLAGYPMVDVRATLYDGKEHPVDSSEMAFKIAGSLAFKKATQDAGIELLEPIYDIEITIPEEFTGDVIGDLNTKRAQVQGMNQFGGMTTIQGQAPQAELLRYATDLKALTQGRGTYRMTFSHYQEVPAHLAQQVAEKLRAEHEAKKA